MKRLAAQLVRAVLALVYGVGLLLPIILQFATPLAGWLKQHTGYDAMPAASVLTVILALGGLFRQRVAGFLRKKLLASDINFAKIMWPAQPAKLPAPAQLVKRTRLLVQDRCDKRLAAIEQELRKAKLAVLPQRWVQYETIADFLVPEAPGLPAADLPPLGKSSSLLKAGSAVALVGEAGSGKSYALLGQLARHLKTAGKILPVYLDLADWHKLFNVTDEHRLERWACKFTCEAYAPRRPAAKEGSQPEDATEENTQLKEAKKKGILPEEAIWLLHRQTQDMKLVLCLDGLDELMPEYQQECLEAILDYKVNGGHVVFTCRRKELTTCLAALPAERKETDCLVFALRDFATAEEVDEAIMRHSPDLATAEPLLRYRREHQMQEYLTTPLLINLFVRIFLAGGSSGLPSMADAAAQPTGVPGLLWAGYEQLQWQASHAYDNHLREAAFWPAFRTYLHHLAVQAGRNSFTLDTIQPYKWLAQPIEAAPWPPAPAPPPAPAADAPPPTFPVYLGWYYLASRLAVGLLLAVAVGCLIARPWAFLGDGVLIGGLAALFMRLNYRAGVLEPKRQYVLRALLFLGLLVLVCGAYEGLTVPRKPGDMHWYGLFSVTQAIFGVIVGLIAGIVLGFRRAHTRDNDISLVERLGIKWLEAFGVGLLVGGLGIGLVIGAVGVGLLTLFPDTTLGNWLAAYLPGWQRHVAWLVALRPANAHAIAVFSLAFVVAGLVGFVLVTLLASLDRKHSMLEDSERNDKGLVRYGVAQSARYGLFNGLLVVGLVLGGLFGLAALADGQYAARLGRYLSVAIGAGLIAFLWFGGVEFLQHYVLRVILALLRRLPLRFRRWLFAARELAFVQGRSGPAIKFAHTKLWEYLQYAPRLGSGSSAEPLAPVPTLPALPRREWRWFQASLVALMLVLLASPLLRRWWPAWPGATYWTHANALDLRPAPGVAVLTDSTVRMLRAGRLQFRVEGRVHVGDIVGSVGPRGSAYGFFGMPLDHAYDRFNTANHGALFYRIQRAAGGGGWHPLPAAAAAGWLLPWQNLPVITLPELLRAGEQVQFAVNDAEWQNNSGHFTLTFEPSPAPKARRP